MVQYTYKDFNVSYDISYSNPDGYDANGSIQYIENDKVIFSRKFSTKYSSSDGAETEIKKLMEEFIDFECRQAEKKQ